MKYAILLLFVVGCQQPAGNPPTQARTALLTAMNDRLTLMEQVAAYKFVNKKPIADPEREAALLEAMETRAPSFGLPPQDVRRFFEAQIEAAKMVQANLMGTWQASGLNLPAPPSLDELRQKIDRVNEALLHALNHDRPFRDQKQELHSAAEKLLVAPGVTAEVRQQALRPLMQ